MSKFKKLFCVFTVLTLCVSFPFKAVAAVTEPKINLIADGEVVIFADDSKPINVDGRIFVPVDAIVPIISGESEAECVMEAAAVTLKNEVVSVKLFLDKNEVLIGEEAATIETVGAMNYKGKVYVPLRFVANVFYMEVNWNDNTKTASVMGENYFSKISEVFAKSTSSLSVDKKFALDLTANIKLEMTAGGETVALSSDNSFKVQVDYKNKFIHYVLDKDNKTDMYGGDNGHVIDNIYDDGENMYVVYEDGCEKTESPFAGATDEDYFNSINDSLMSLISEIIFPGGIDINLLASIQMSKDNDGNAVLSCFVPMSDMFRRVMSSYPFYIDENADLNISVDANKPLLVKAVFNKTTGDIISFSAEADALLKLYAPEYDESLFVKVVLNANLGNVDFDAKFDSVVPEEIKKNAVQMVVPEYNEEDSYSLPEYNLGEATPPANKEMTEAEKAEYEELRKLLEQYGESLVIE